MKKNIQDLVIQHKNNQQDVFNDIYNHYVKKFEYFSFNNLAEVDEDMVSHLSIILLNCIDKYDESNKTCFNTYLWTSVKNYYVGTKIKNNAKKRKEYNGNKIVNISLSSEYNNSNDDKKVMWQDVIADEKSKKPNINKIALYGFIDSCEEMSKNEKIIIKMLYENIPQTEIAKELGITSAAVCFTIKNIHKKSYAQNLYKLLKD